MTREWKDWKVGEEDYEGELIDVITGGGGDLPFIVYFVKSNDQSWLKWHFDKHEVKFGHTIEALAQNYLVRGKHSIKDTNGDLGYFKEIMAASIAHAFSEADQKRNFEKYFKEASSYIQAKAIAPLHYSYLAAVTGYVTFLGLVSLVFILDLVAISGDIRHVLIGAVCGSVGAYVSVLQRLSRSKDEMLHVEINQYAGKWGIMFEGFSRITLGSIFGIILVFGQKSGLILNLADSNTYFMALLSTVAGISERVIPSIVKSVENVVQKNSEENIKA